MPNLIFSRIILSLSLATGLVGAQYFAPLPLNAGDLKAIQRRGYLIVAVKDNLRPLGFKDTTGQLQGLEIDLARRLAEELLGRSDAVTLQPVLNQDRIPVVLDDQVDIAIARVTATAARERLVSFSVPYYMDGATLITKDPAIRRLSDLGRRPVAVLNGSSTVPSVRYLLPNANLVGVESYTAGRSLLESGKVVAFAADASILSGWVQQEPQYRLLPSLLSAEPLCVVMPKGVQYDDLRRRINQAIARWQAEGWLKERAAYWGLP